MFTQRRSFADPKVKLKRKFVSSCKESFFKTTVHPEKNMQLLFTQPHIVQNLYVVVYFCGTLKFSFAEAPRSNFSANWYKNLK